MAQSHGGGAFCSGFWRLLGSEGCVIDGLSGVRSSHIIGPTLFGVTYMKTVGTVPGAIYGLCCASLFVSLLLLLLIRLRKTGGHGVGGEASSR